MRKNKIDRNFINSTDQTTLKSETLICVICDKKILESQKFDRIVYVGITHWYHESCGKQLVFDFVDKLPSEKKYGDNP
jgi:hypothetical protein